MKKVKMKSDAELAAYWDTHSAADIWDELEFDSGVSFDEDLRVVRSIRLKPSEVKAIELVARHRGTSSSSVIRGYLREGLRNEPAARAGAREKNRGRKRARPTASKAIVKRPAQHRASHRAASTGLRASASSTRSTARASTRQSE